MRAPGFWWQTPPSLPALLLWPLGWLWGEISRQRMTRAGTEADAPVLCIGNFTAGGAGKTPAAIACANILRRKGYTPAFLSRGYGGSLARDGSAHTIDPHRHTAAQAGDEPLLLAEHAPAIVASDRVMGAHSATAMGADIIVMDDGLQNPGLKKTISIAVVDGVTGIGNGLCIPAGPLRAPMSVQLPKVDALIVVGAGEQGQDVAAQAARYGKAVFHGVLAPDPATVARLRGHKVVAFAGIGRPGKFFDTLEAAGIQVAEAFAFDDHQTLDAKEIELLKRTARNLEATLITTEKDFVRVGRDFGTFPPDVLPVSLVLEDENAFTAFLTRELARGAAQAK
ncbi:MAG: tetraacyldisaccharide 4'-kinase [Hyphomicrobiales bacterium]|nr:tetraacyldisaccharide 4'-kinase [Hyphomicrobiales bacterium]